MAILEGEGDREKGRRGRFYFFLCVTLFYL
jgi:hypothetical protein